jgi:hypothetical protein
VRGQAMGHVMPPDVQQAVGRMGRQPAAPMAWFPRAAA